MWHMEEGMGACQESGMGGQREWHGKVHTLPGWGAVTLEEEKERGWALNQPLRGFPVAGIKLHHLSASRCPIH